MSYPNILYLTFTKEGDIVVDPFMGTGVTANACIRLQRHFVGFELDETCYKVALNNLCYWRK